VKGRNHPRAFLGECATKLGVMLAPQRTWSDGWPDPDNGV